MEDNRCIICGALIPEGRQTCLICEAEILDKCDSKKDESVDCKLDNLIKYV